MTGRLRISIRRGAATLMLAVWTIAATLSGPAQAGLTRAELSDVGFADRAGRTLPADIPFDDAAGKTANLGARLGGEAGLVAFVDYTCETVCGVAVNALAAAEAALKEGGIDHRILVIGFDPRDNAEDRAAWLAGNPQAASLGEAAFLSTSATDTARLIDAAGLKTSYDDTRDQFAHPAGALLVGANGRIVRALDLVSLEPETLRFALIEASGGKAGTIIERAILSCYGWDAETGRYTPLVDRMLLAGCGGTVALVAGFVGLMLLRERRRSRPERQAGITPLPAGENGHG
ncbi:SCO family protein [Jiella marina]|uniref:SCO family protein n=1 Tax=Jiella sp. LLJ827 TaxID=2917712 RepID=UPI0021010CCB|nr:SCO family protein [Jiella sp. LLJ827]MCQ0987074.1 SCO family protein [Jiella sp. LLJ827]